MRRRPASPADAPLLDALADLAVGVELVGLPASLTSPLLAAQRAGRERTWRAAWPDHAHEVLEVDGHAVGDLRLARSGDTIVVIDLNVHPAARGRGIAAEALRDVFAEAGDREVRASVTSRSPARALHRRVGFREVEDDGVYVRLVWRRPG
jgi:GNAT superfamily N-acetyltransferase